MMKLNAGMVLLAAVTMLLPPVATAKDVKVSGAGVRKCEEWNTWKNEKNGEARALAVEWSLGFVSGHNVYARGDATQSLVNPNAKTVAALLDTYCQKRPDDRLFLGVIDMVRSLGGARVTTPPPTRSRPDGGKPEL